VRYPQTGDGCRECLWKEEGPSGHPASTQGFGLLKRDFKIECANLEVTEYAMERCSNGGGKIESTWKLGDHRQLACRFLATAVLWLGRT